MQLLLSVREHFVLMSCKQNGCEGVNNNLFEGVAHLMHITCSAHGSAVPSVSISCLTVAELMQPFCEVLQCPSYSRNAMQDRFFPG